MFWFILGENGIIAPTHKPTLTGGASTYWAKLLPEYCNYSAASSTGASCGTWILRKGNADYRHRNVTAEWGY